MIAPSTAGFRTYQSSPSALVTVMKSLPRNTPVTPSTSNRRRASGELAARSGSVKSSTPRAVTSRPGRNFRLAGFGVCSVWMNIAQRLLVALGPR